MICLNCKNLYSHSSNYTDITYRCRVHKHKEIKEPNIDITCNEYIERKVGDKDKKNTKN